MTGQDYSDALAAYREREPRLWEDGRCDDESAERDLDQRRTTLDAAGCTGASTTGTPTRPPATAPCRRTDPGAPASPGAVPHAPPQTGA